MNIRTQGWQDIDILQPLDPRFIILNSTLGSSAGQFTRSTTFLQGLWGTNPFAYTGTNTVLASLDTTDAATTVEAAQWSFLHQMVNTSSALGTAMRKVVFMRAGRIWDNRVEISFGGATYSDVQLSFRDNLGTSGIFLNGSSGSIPVASFSGTFTGNNILHVTLRRPGVYSMVIVANNGTNYSTFEMEWVVLP